MKTQIFKLEQEAIEAAQIACIREMEKQFNVEVSDGELINNPKLWLVNHTSTSCECGQCSAVDVTLFTRFITDEAELPAKTDEQYSNYAGICDVCGEGEFPVEENTYDVVFNNDNSSNAKGFKCSLDYCQSYINHYNGTKESYFEDYKGGTVSIFCHETEETVFETEVL